MAPEEKDLGHEHPRIGGKIMLVTCLCTHKFQDKLYGCGIRSANLITSSQSVLEVYRCTVCGGEIHTNRKRHGAAKKTGAGGGKNRYTFETAEHLRARFNKTRSIGARI